MLKAPLANQTDRSMHDIIHLLSDAIANQIAAGEVVQRPASVVKELLENAIDAQSTYIQLIVKDAGRTLIQVIDDGIGMSPTDARMSFERHATSKISKSEDLFSIRTMGFRGEALASIAAVAQVELKSARSFDEMGTFIRIEGSQVKEQEPIATRTGTSISVKNLFFNVPARRNFLKTNAVEMKHILDEFQRIALAHPEVQFSLHHNEHEIFVLPAGKLSKRIVDIFGKNYREQLAKCQEETPFVSVKGYVGKPESAKKTRGEQFFFVNNRYIRHGYLHHAVVSAYESTIPEGASPFYVLFIEIDPSHIDINIHPTKTEVKFDDEKAIYAIIRSAVRQALGVYNLSPSLDFESDINFGNLTTSGPETSFQTLPSRASMDSIETRGPSSVQFPSKSNRPDGWEALFEGLPDPSAPVTLGSKANQRPAGQIELSELDHIQGFQIQNQIIAVPLKSGLLLVHQRGAYERILYEKYYASLKNHQGTSQQLLFPKVLTLQPADFTFAFEFQEMLGALGFDFEEFGPYTVKLNGVPPEVKEENEAEIFEGLIHQFKENEATLRLDQWENLARSFARRSSHKYIGPLSPIEINLLVHQLFETPVPNYTPGGEPIVSMVEANRLIALIQGL